MGKGKSGPVQNSNFCYELILVHTPYLRQLLGTNVEMDLVYQYMVLPFYWWLGSAACFVF